DTTATVSITVNSVNDAPDAVDDSYTVSQDTPRSVLAPGLLANDTDVDGGTLTSGSPSDPPHGSVSLSSNGSFTYAPDAGYIGPGPPLDGRRRWRRDGHVVGHRKPERHRLGGSLRLVLHPRTEPAGVGLHGRCGSREPEPDGAAQRHAGLHVRAAAVHQ